MCRNDANRTCNLVGALNPLGSPWAKEIRGNELGHQSNFPMGRVWLEELFMAALLLGNTRQSGGAEYAKTRVFCPL